MRNTLFSFAGGCGLPSVIYLWLSSRCLTILSRSGAHFPIVNPRGCGVHEQFPKCACATRCLSWTCVGPGQRVRIVQFVRLVIIPYLANVTAICCQSFCVLGRCQSVRLVQLPTQTPRCTWSTLGCAGLCHIHPVSWGCETPGNPSNFSITLAAFYIF